MHYLIEMNESTCFIGNYLRALNSWEFQKSQHNGPMVLKARFLKNCGLEISRVLRVYDNRVTHQKKGMFDVMSEMYVLDKFIIYLKSRGIDFSKYEPFSYFDYANNKFGYRDAWTDKENYFHAGMKAQHEVLQKEITKRAERVDDKDNAIKKLIKQKESMGRGVTDLLEKINNLEKENQELKLTIERTPLCKCANWARCGTVEEFGIHHPNCELNKNHQE